MDRYRIKDLFSSCHYLTYIGTGGMIFIMVTMIVIDYAPKWAWSVVLGIIDISLVTQRHVKRFVTHQNIRNNHIFMIGAVHSGVNSICEARAC